jgi:hypothetical protein
MGKTAKRQKMETYDQGQGIDVKGLLVFGMYTLI